MGYEFFGEKIIFPSTPVLGINDDQSLKKAVVFHEIYQAMTKFHSNFIDFLTDYEKHVSN